MCNTREEVDVDEVKLNTVLAVKAGEVIPIDGVVDGNCEVDEKTLTGGSFPVTKQVDSVVTTALAEDCVAAKMAKLVEEARNSKSKTRRFIDKFAQYYTPAVIFMPAGVALIPVALRVHNRDHWFYLALIVLMTEERYAVFQQIKQLQQELAGLDGDEHVNHSLTTMDASCGEMGFARKVFDEMGDRDLVSWNSMISGYSKMGFAKEAIGLFMEMREEGFEPDEMTLVNVLGACGDLGLGRWVEGLVLEKKMEGL
ncbi:putative inactive cadmium/zinc-transporting ATPase HMA3 [Populus trichocarpa]|uniref:putative inactive cadmium/zinc-transporting ATPase HMA3 n=1 Tax=Populus trichocarpa TaxID=3694 RepID=UPI002277D336|nr:putative inactive cadmium/zinc-transporting ATPase HMA3 [Populus trichocarpa]